MSVPCPPVAVQWPGSHPHNGLAIQATSLGTWGVRPPPLVWPYRDSFQATSLGTLGVRRVTHFLPSIAHYSNIPGQVLPLSNIGNPKYCKPDYCQIAATDRHQHELVASYSHPSNALNMSNLIEVSGSRGIRKRHISIQIKLIKHCYQQTRAKPGAAPQTAS